MLIVCSIPSCEDEPGACVLNRRPGTLALIEMSMSARAGRLMIRTPRRGDQRSRGRNRDPAVGQDLQLVRADVEEERARDAERTREAECLQLVELQVVKSSTTGGLLGPVRTLAWQGCHRRREAREN